MDRHTHHSDHEHRDRTTIEQDASEQRLEPTSPQTAVNLYTDARKDEVAKATRKSQQYRLGKFVEWCGQEGIENMNVLTGRDCYQYRIWLQNTDLKAYTVQGIMSTLKTFVAFCERIEVVQGGLSDKILIPKVDVEDRTRDTILDAQRAHDIREHLRKFQWSSRSHVIFEILWHIPVRVGGLHSLDVEDFDEQDQRLELTHRPNRETTLKNGSDGERPVALSDVVTEIVADYIQYNRTDVTDEYGRQPLITSEKGRLCKSQIRRVVGYVTQPCMVEPCPHGKTPEHCEWRTFHDSHSCPSASNPHDLRRGSITHMKNEDVPTEVISDRANADRRVLEEHYDKRTPDERMELRRRYIDELDL